MTAGSVPGEGTSGSVVVASAPATAPDGEAPLAWRAAWIPALARSKPFHLALCFGLLLGAVVAVLALLPPLAGGAMLAVVLVTLDELLLPVAYRIDATGVRIATPLRRRSHAWGEFTAALTTDEGVLLRSPYRRSVHLLARTPALRIEAARRASAALAAIAAQRGRDAPASRGRAPGGGGGPAASGSA